MTAKRTLPALAAVAVAAIAMSTPTGRTAAQTVVAEAPATEIVVTGYPDIVVNGRAIRCRRLAGDPLDHVSIGGGWGDHMMIVPDEEGGFSAQRVTERITGPEFWQRVGMGMGAYAFRAPRDGRPMCIGGRGGAQSFGGFRRIVDAEPYRGRRLRFTAWAATSDADQVSFWLAAGTQWREKRRQFEIQRTPFFSLTNGGNTNNVPFGGDHGWTPVLLETGPIKQDADHISYGFNLQGRGNVWVYQPKLEIVADWDGRSRRDLIAIGRSER